MPPCPFTRERLSELLLIDHWRPAQIAVLAGAATGEVITEPQVIEWLEAAGIETGPKPPMRLTPPQASPKGTRRAPRRPTVPPEERRALAEEAKRGILPEAGPAAAAVPGEKRCAACRHMKPIREFPVDASRSDLHARICRLCRREKNREYYRANAERLKAKAAAYQRAKRAAGE